MEFRNQSIIENNSGLQTAEEKNLELRKTVKEKQDHTKTDQKLSQSNTRIY